MFDIVLKTLHLGILLQQDYSFLEEKIMNKKIFFTVSYMALLLLFSQTTIIGLAITLILCFAGSVYFIKFTKIDFKISLNREAVSIFLVAIILMSKLGEVFYMRWIPASKVAYIVLVKSFCKCELRNQHS